MKIKYMNIEKRITELIIGNLWKPLEIELYLYAIAISKKNRSL